MDAFLTSQEMPIRLGVFLGIFAIYGGVGGSGLHAESLQQRRSLRWSNNLALLASSMASSSGQSCLLTAVGIAAFAAVALAWAH